MIGLATDPERYQSFLLRLWKETPDLPWRFQVRCVSTGNEYRFAELEQVLAFLRNAADGEPDVELAWGGQAQDAVSGQGEALSRFNLAYI